MRTGGLIIEYIASNARQFAAIAIAHFFCDDGTQLHTRDEPVADFERGHLQCAMEWIGNGAKRNVLGMKVLHRCT